MSSAKAMGLMQLIPATAKRMAKSLGVSYSPNGLLANPGYNIALGSYYLGSLVNQWDGSYILAIASYNAGPGNVRKWTKKYRDPRNFKNIYDVIDWIESIPFNETRNYVERVLENIQVYRSKIPENTLTLEDDLMRAVAR
jgi:soluble lytic murein transglycosylase